MQSEWGFWRCVDTCQNNIFDSALAVVFAVQQLFAEYLFADMIAHTRSTGLYYEL